MHSMNQRADEINVLKSIVDTRLEFLAAKTDDWHNYLTIHSFASGRDEEAVSQYVPLLAEVGQEHGIGGQDKGMGG